MSTVDLLAPTVNVFGEPGDTIVIEINVPTTYESGTWVGTLWDSLCQDTPTASFVVTPPNSSPVILTLNTTGLVPPWASSFTGHWELDRIAGGETRTWVKGDFILDSGRHQLGV